MSSQRVGRRSYEESCRLLQSIGYRDVGSNREIPPMPKQRPRYDDKEPLGVRFFRTLVGKDIEYGIDDESHRDLENLTLPRTFFGRSLIQCVSFKNTDLSESALCWNDFLDVNFTDADLSESDLRASIFKGVVFMRAKLRNADLRRSRFLGCDFTEADMRVAKLTRKQGGEIELSEQQLQEISWQDCDGERAPGG